MIRGFKNFANISSRELPEFLRRAEAAQGLRGRYCARSDCMAAHARRDTSSSFEIARMLVRFDHVASFIVDARRPNGSASLIRSTPRLSLRARGEWSRKGKQAVPNRQPFGVS